MNILFSKFAVKRKTIRLLQIDLDHAKILSDKIDKTYNRLDEKGSSKTILNVTDDDLETMIRIFHQIIK